jgi:hypothetical protein
MPDAELWVLLHSSNAIDAVSLKVGGQVKSVAPEPLGIGGWHLLRVSASDLEGGTDLWADGDVIATQCFYLKAGKIREAPELLRQPPQSKHKVADFVARWARQNAAISVPPAGEAGGVLLMFMTPPEEAGRSVKTAIACGKSKSLLVLPGGSWRWSAVYVAPGTPAGDMRFKTDAPFNPKVRGFAEDLILFMGYGKFMQL